MLASVKSCTFTPTGSQLLAAGRTGHIQIYEVSREGMLKEVGQFPGHSQEVTCMSVSADGKFVVSGGKEKKLRFWEIATGQEKGVFPGFEGAIKASVVAEDETDSGLRAPRYDRSSRSCGDLLPARRRKQLSP